MILLQIDPTAGKSLLDYGVLGAIVVILFGVLVYLYNSNAKERKETHERHAAERKEWREQSQAQHESIVDATNRNTDVVSELKTLLLSIERRIQ